jgi:chemotaxis protein CheC
MNLQELRPAQADALREVANIGSGHAATALSQMTGARINISVPELRLVPVNSLTASVGARDEVIAAVLLRVLGAIPGRTLLVLSRDSALHLADTLLSRPAGQSQAFGPIEESALMEAGNILASAYLNALSACTGAVLLPSVPVLVIDLCQAVFSTVHAPGIESFDCAFSVETELSVADGHPPIRAQFVLLPEAGTLEEMLRALNLA